MAVGNLNLIELGFVPSTLVNGDFSHPAFPFEVRESQGWMRLRDVKGDYASFCIAIKEEVEKTIKLYEENVEYIQFLKTRTR